MSLTGPDGLPRPSGLGLRLAYVMLNGFIKIRLAAALMRSRFAGLASRGPA